MLTPKSFRHVVGRCSGCIPPLLPPVPPPLPAVANLTASAQHEIVVTASSTEVSVEQQRENKELRVAETKKRRGGQRKKKIATATPSTTTEPPGSAGSSVSSRTAANRTHTEAVLKVLAHSLPPGVLWLPPPSGATSAFSASPGFSAGASSVSPDCFFDVAAAARDAAGGGRRRVDYDPKMLNRRTPIAPSRAAAYGGLPSNAQLTDGHGIGGGRSRASAPTVLGVAPSLNELLALASDGTRGRPSVAAASLMYGAGQTRTPVRDSETQEWLLKPADAKKKKDAKTKNNEKRIKKESRSRGEHSSVPATTTPEGGERVPLFPEGLFRETSPSSSSSTAFPSSSSPSSSPSSLPYAPSPLPIEPGLNAAVDVCAWMLFARHSVASLGAQYGTVGGGCEASSRTANLLHTWLHNGLALMGRPDVDWGHASGHVPYTIGCDVLANEPLRRCESVTRSPTGGYDSSSSISRGGEGVDGMVMREGPIVASAFSRILVEESIGGTFGRLGGVHGGGTIASPSPASAFDQTVADFVDSFNALSVESFFNEAEQRRESARLVEQRAAEEARAAAAVASAVETLDLTPVPYDGGRARAESALSREAARQAVAEEVAAGVELGEGGLGIVSVTSRTCPRIAEALASHDDSSLAGRIPATAEDFFRAYGNDGCYTQLLDEAGERAGISATDPAAKVVAAGAVESTFFDGDEGVTSEQFADPLSSSSCAEEAVAGEGPFSVGFGEDDARGFVGFLPNSANSDVGAGAGHKSRSNQQHVVWDGTSSLPALDWSDDAVNWGADDEALSSVAGGGLGGGDVEALPIELADSLAPSLFCRNSIADLAAPRPEQRFAAKGGSDDDIEASTTPRFSYIPTDGSGNMAAEVRTPELLSLPRETAPLGGYHERPPQEKLMAFEHLLDGTEVLKAFGALSNLARGARQRTEAIERAAAGAEAEAAAKCGGADTATNLRVDRAAALGRPQLVVAPKVQQPPMSFYTAQLATRHGEGHRAESASLASSFFVSPEHGRSPAAAAPFVLPSVGARDVGFFGLFSDESPAITVSGRRPRMTTERPFRMRRWVRLQGVFITSTLRQRRANEDAWAQHASSHRSRSQFKVASRGRVHTFTSDDNRAALLAGTAEGRAEAGTKHKGTVVDGAIIAETSAGGNPSDVFSSSSSSASALGPPSSESTWGRRMRERILRNRDAAARREAKGKGKGNERKRGPEENGCAATSSATDDILETIDGMENEGIEALAKRWSDSRNSTASSRIDTINRKNIRKGRPLLLSGDAMAGERRRVGEGEEASPTDSPTSRRSGGNSAPHPPPARWRSHASKAPFGQPRLLTTSVVTNAYAEDLIACATPVGGPHLPPRYAALRGIQRQLTAGEDVAVEENEGKYAEVHPAAAGRDGGGSLEKKTSGSGMGTTAAKDGKKGVGVGAGRDAASLVALLQRLFKASAQRDAAPLIATIPYVTASLVPAPIEAEAEQEASADSPVVPSSLEEIRELIAKGDAAGAAAAAARASQSYYPSLHQTVASNASSASSTPTRSEADSSETEATDTTKERTASAKKGGKGRKSKGTIEKAAKKQQQHGAAETVDNHARHTNKTDTDNNALTTTSSGGTQNSSGSSGPKTAPATTPRRYYLHFGAIAVANKAFVEATDATYASMAAADAAVRETMRYVSAVAGEAEDEFVRNRWSEALRPYELASFADEAWQAVRSDREALRAARIAAEADTSLHGLTAPALLDNMTAPMPDADPATAAANELGRGGEEIGGGSDVDLNAAKDHFRSVGLYCAGTWMARRVRGSSYVAEAREKMLLQKGGEGVPSRPRPRAAAPAFKPLDEASFEDLVNYVTKATDAEERSAEEADDATRRAAAARRDEDGDDAVAPSVPKIRRSRYLRFRQRHHIISLRKVARTSPDFAHFKRSLSRGRSGFDAFHRRRANERARRVGALVRGFIRDYVAPPAVNTSRDGVLDLKAPAVLMNGALIPLSLAKLIHELTSGGTHCTAPSRGAVVALGNGHRVSYSVAAARTVAEVARDVLIDFSETSRREEEALARLQKAKMGNAGNESKRLHDVEAGEEEEAVSSNLTTSSSDGYPSASGTVAAHAAVDDDDAACLAGATAAVAKARARSARMQATWAEQLCTPEQWSQWRSGWSTNPLSDSVLGLPDRGGGGGELRRRRPKDSHSVFFRAAVRGVSREEAANLDALLFPE